MSTKICNDEFREIRHNNSLDAMEDNRTKTMSVETFTKKTPDDVELTTKHHFILKVFKNFTIRFYKPLLIVKLAMFFWFAGAFGGNAYFAVFMKQRGLGLTEFSLVTAGSVVFQLLGSSLSGIIADKIGRPKPMLYAHMVICFFVSISFLLIPKLTVDSRTRYFQLLSSNNNSSVLITELSCNASDSFIHEETCKLQYYTNTSYSSNNENCIFVIDKENNSSFDIYFEDNGIHAFEKTELCCIERSSSIPISISPTICNYTYCMVLEDKCFYERGNSKQNSYRIFLSSVYYLLITLYYLALSCVFCFYDVSAISLTEEHSADYGRQRVFSMLGSLVGPFLLGYVMQVTSSGDEKNYSLAFVFFNICIMLSCLLIRQVEIQRKEPGTRMWRKSLILLKKPDICAFILVLLVSGTSYSFNFIFANLYLEGLGASKMLLGLVYPVSNVFALLFLFNSKWWIHKIGVHNMFILALLSHALFNISYSFLKEPWVAILIGTATTVFAYQLMWVSVMHYSHSIAPDGLYATVIVMAGTLHFTISRMSASLIGGMIMDAYGGRIAFRVIGTICFATAILYATFHYFRRYRTLRI